ncbi:MAG: GNAT family N-acetyltransferase, partial [Thermoanaerobaculales bacterium]
MEKHIKVEAGEFRFREYRRDDEAKVLALWKLAFGKDPSVPIWRWKYADNPFGHRILLCVDSADKLAVVMYAGAPYRATLRGGTVEIVQLMDIMSHPEYRKTGLFVKSADAFFELFAGGESVLYYGIPSEYHFNIGNKYLHYSRLESGVSYLSCAPHQLRGARRVLGGVVDEAESIDERFDRLWERQRRHYPLAVVRDAAFLRWRFIAHPEKDYSIYTYRSRLARELRGYAVVGFEGETARLVDLLMPPGQRQMTDFLARLAELAADRGAARLETWLPGGHFLTAGVHSAGWVREEEPLGIVPTARSFDEKLTIPWV